ncbi:Transducin/WD40 repeat-like superfamily protein [Raphanus sativus]|nr:Transducin/WD40 repeat-like superfamily protein [Raphanus sativus]
MSPSPWNQTYSPYYKSPWIYQTRNIDDDFDNGLIGTIVRQEGHVYSLAASEIFYSLDPIPRTFGSGKISRISPAIVITGDNRIFTGHQDGKIRVWRGSKTRTGGYSRIGSLPTLKEFLTKSVNPKNYVEVVAGKRSQDPTLRRRFVSELERRARFTLLRFVGQDSQSLETLRLQMPRIDSSSRRRDQHRRRRVRRLALHRIRRRDFESVETRASRRGTKHFLVNVLMKEESAFDGVGGKKYLSHGGHPRPSYGGALSRGCREFGAERRRDKNICVWRRNGDGMHTCLSVLMDHVGPVKCLTAVEERRGIRRRR